MNLTSLDYLTSDTYNICCFIIIGLILIFIGNGKKGNMSSFILLGILVGIFPFIFPYTGQAITSLTLKEEAIIKDNPQLYFKSSLKSISEEYPDIYIADDGYEFIYRPANLQKLSLINNWGAVQFYEHKNGDTYEFTDNVILDIEYTNEAPYIEVYTFSSENKYQNYLLNNPRTFGTPVYIKLYINSDSQISKDLSYQKSIMDGVKFVAYLKERLNALYLISSFNLSNSLFK